MCRMVFIGETEACETQRELRHALGSIIYRPDAPPGAKHDDTGCLCWVDVAQMAAREGYAVDERGDWILTKR